ncbi:hypothetical protein D3C72_2523300 [compost metagenome]
MGAAQKVGGGQGGLATADDEYIHCSRGIHAEASCVQGNDWRREECGNLNMRIIEYAGFFASWRRVVCRVRG